ncbi:MAG: tripartite tricarboxylate transporter permease [Methanococcus maripaludis]|uniref:Tripartite tricarboxylate transporter permease n=1 Tax=Methanococcus maripaludis TaxID=39152 RepID=A0A8T3W7H8_METMI|nr:tripartite tricarboxylate transporter permease [Methanococcus maripaludis]MBG0769133.1 tripartite tricarboxylate transporter permease [Methanococcus maripaludis]
MNNLFFLIFGIATGTITGLIPGIHPNTLIPISVIFYPYFGSSNYFSFLIGLLISHYFLNYIPSAFIGVPDDESAVAAVPMHNLTILGRGYEAVVLAGFGAFFGIICSIFLFLIISRINIDFQSFYSYLKPFLPYILMLFLLISVIFSKNRVWTTLIILFSGILGIIVFYKNPSFDYSLTVIFTGMFGIPLLFENLNKKELGNQFISFPELKFSYLKSAVFGTFGGFFRIFIPATGGAQINYFLSKLIKEENIENFIISQGSITLSNELFSILAIMMIGTGRSGISEIITSLNIGYTQSELFSSALIATGISFLSLTVISKYFLQNINKFDYGLISKVLIVFCTILVLILSFKAYLIYHVVIYLISISIGVLCVKNRVNLSNMMGVLIFPTILYFLKI